MRELTLEEENAVSGGGLVKLIRWLLRPSELGDGTCEAEGADCSRSYPGDDVFNDGFEP